MIDKHQKVMIQAPQRGAVIATTTGFGDTLGPFEKRAVRVGEAQLYVLAGCYVIGPPPGAPDEALSVESDGEVGEIPTPIVKPIRNK
jgi:hypothetical protein